MSVSIPLNQHLYSSNTAPSCEPDKVTLDPVIETDQYWCFTTAAKDTLTQQVMGDVLLVVSKKRINGLIRQNLVNNVFVISLLTATIFGFFYYLTKRLTAP